MRFRWRKIRKWALRLGGFSLVAALGAGGYFYDYPRVAADLPEAVLAYRDAGLPWTAKDLAPNLPVKPEENAAPLLRAAIAAWPQSQRTGDGVTRTVYEDKIYSARQYGEPLAPLLPPLERSMALAHEAALRPRLDFGRDWDLGQSLLMPEESRVKVLANAFAARASVRCEEGDDAGALADLEDARRLGRLVASEPSMIAAFVGAGCEALALQGAQECLVMVAGSPRRLLRFREWLAQPAPLPNLNRALRGELYAIVATLRNLDREDSGGFFPDALRLGPGDVPELSGTGRPLRHTELPGDLRDRAYLARCLRRWTELADATHGLTDPVDRIGQEAEWIVAAHQGVQTAVSFYEGSLFPTYVNLGRTNRRTTARRALALLYADALLQHARTGAWPSSSTFPDPLGEGTFHVRIDPDGRFRVWSVGDNGVDDGGFTNWEPTEWSDDLVAAYPPIPRKPYRRPDPKIVPPGFRSD